MSEVKISVIGAGVMGSGLAQNLAQSKLHVVLIDIHEEALQNAEEIIRKNVRFSAFFAPLNIRFAPNK